jgi:hypothetical protein
MPISCVEPLGKIRELPCWLSQANPNQTKSLLDPIDVGPRTRRRSDLRMRRYQSATAFTVVGPAVIRARQCSVRYLAQGQFSAAVNAEILPCGRAAFASPQNNVTPKDPPRDGLVAGKIGGCDRGMPFIYKNRIGNGLFVGVQGFTRVFYCGSRRDSKCAWRHSPSSWRKTLPLRTHLAVRTKCGFDPPIPSRSGKPTCGVIPTATAPAEKDPATLRAA